MNKKLGVKGPECNDWCFLTSGSGHNSYCPGYVGTDNYFAKLTKDAKADYKILGRPSGRSIPAIGRRHRQDRLDGPSKDRPNASWCLDGRSRGELMRDYWMRRAADRSLAERGLRPKK